MIVSPGGSTGLNLKPRVRIFLAGSRLGLRLGRGWVVEIGKNTKLTDTAD